MALDTITQSPQTCPMGLGHGFFMGYGWVFQLLILLLLALIFWWLLRGNQFGYGANTNSTPIEILKRRYAAGEITKKEFDRLKKELK
jgi:putative membrane protein